MTNATSTFYYHRDPLNTVSDVTNATGVAQWKYEYDGYGVSRTAQNVSGSAPESRLRFNGQYFDSETSHYYLRARQYDPVAGRFGALDPIENSMDVPYRSAYVYGDAQPTAITDPVGLCGVCEAVASKIELPFVDVPHLQDVSNSAAGFGDFITFSGTSKLRGLWGANDVVDSDSWAYRSGEAGAAVAGLFNPESDAATFGAICRSAGEARGARFVVDSAGETRIFLRNGLEVNEHAAYRMAGRRISVDEVDAVVGHSSPFVYFHKGVWKTGYYDAGSNIFVATYKHEVLSVFKPGAGTQYIKNLTAKRP